ncbi:hydrogen peroxide-inducible genes activator [Lunatimonas salinarum]|uniref:hydrogen peroxide-inducible genes activator n=1 Tax=Lunatimonas salinarum TaxID=1774590 RepID=UPI001ADFB6B7|nr:hydrogen peroxide-inducible genes activator [Lunatimonas salinarum]
MTIQQLEYIIAVDRYRHFGQAAEACFVTQPTLSAQVSKLEKELGVIFFDRSKMPVIPTETGEILIAQARRVVAESKGILETVAQLKGEVGGLLKLGIIPTLAPYLLPLFIKGFIRKYPNVKLQVQELVTEDILKRLKSDELDIGIVVTPLGESGILEKPIFYEKFYAYLSVNHRQLQKDKVRIVDILGEDLWVLQQGHCFRDQVLSLCEPSKFQRMNFQYESGSLEGLKNLVNKYDGITLLPELATLGLSEEEKSRVRPFDGEQPVREVSLILTRNYLKKKQVELLYQEITNAIPQHMTSKNHGKVVKFR